MSDNTTPAGEFYGSYVLLEKNNDWPMVGWATPGMEAEEVEAWEKEGYEILPFVVLTTAQHDAMQAEIAELQRLRSENAELEAKLAQQPRWEPVEDGAISDTIRAVRNGSLLRVEFEWALGADELHVHLPNGYSLCRIVQPQEPQEDSHE
jgi:hypothetical protein